jgi:hypothetical protein
VPVCPDVGRRLIGDYGHGAAGLTHLLDQRARQVLFRSERAGDGAASVADTSRIGAEEDRRRRNLLAKQRHAD